jgi:hypothetical protein
MQERPTKCIFNKGFSGYLSVVAPPSNIGFGRQETASKSLIADTLDRCMAFYAEE